MSSPTPTSSSGSLHDFFGETVDSVAGTGDICALAESCEELFESYLGTPKLYSSHVLECHRRFLTWLSFLEVLEGGSPCLDKRLQNAPDLKDLVVSMLDVLQTNIRLSIDRHAGDVEGSEVSSLDDVAKQDAGMYGIVGALDRLNRLATVVRRFLTIREGERVLDFAVKQPSNDFRRIISSTIQFLYPTSAESLRAQLVDSIVYRRQRILWRRRNNQLQASSKGRDATGRVPKFSLAAECPPVFESPSGKSMITCGYCLEDLEVHPEAINDGMKSSWSNHLWADLMPFVCVSEECCGSPASICFAKPEEWRKHMFDHHSANWARVIHRVTWQCPKCGTNAEPYTSAGLFVRHLEEDHKDDFSPALTPFQLTRLSVQSKKIEPREPAECPLCGPTWRHPRQLDNEKTQVSSDLHTHVLQHLVHLALLSFFWWEDDTGISTEGDDGGESMAALAAPSRLGSIEDTNDQAHSADFDRDWIVRRALELEGQQAGENLKHQSEAHRKFSRPPIGGSPVEVPDISNAESVTSKWHEVFRVKLEVTSQEALDKSSSTEKGQSPRAHTFSPENSIVRSSRPKDWVVKSISKNLEKSQFPNRGKSFLPEGVLHEIITPEAIDEEFPSLNPNYPDHVDIFYFILSYAKKCFAIAMYIGFRGPELWKIVQLFKNYSFDDTRLPVALESLPWLFKDHPWTTAKHRSFFSAQWKFLVPIFLPSRIEYSFPPSCIFPITEISMSTEDSDRPRGTGLAAANQTGLARIHPNHLRTGLPMIGSWDTPSNTDHVSIAIAKTEVNYRDPRLVEALERSQTLEQLSRLGHPHIIGVFATFGINPCHYMLFHHPEKGNLYDNWAESPASPVLSSTLVKEVLVQMHGLSGAIAAAHHHGICHGLFGPERIFSFPNESRVGMLKILTPGFVASSGAGGTQPLYLRHEAPEVIERQKNSFEGDIWAMGCIIFQWVLYLLYGYDELRGFAESLCEDKSSKQRFFFAFDSGGRAIDHAEVLRYLGYMRSDPKCSPGTALSDLISLMGKHLFKIDVDCRPTANELRNYFHNMLIRAETSQDYLYAPRRVNLIRLGPPTFDDSSSEDGSSSDSSCAAQGDAIPVPVLPGDGAY